ncbi:MAG TPA: sigma-70 family RNA polymerase sigma factor [Kofleriaceae bacterium]|nr:sigma-70 family RNA polymerase sigma factor [Kofleriaceae bacterium]
MNELFEEHRDHLRGVAFRLLGSASEAEDAVQEAWLRLQRADTSEVANLRGWLTTVVARLCLDSLRSRTSRREEPLDAGTAGAAATPTAEQELALADAVGLALLVVLDRLDPAERIAFVLHDLFAVPFDQISTIVGRSAEAARQLASRARKRVQGAPVPEADLAGQRKIVESFITALRSGDVEAVVAVLDPDVVVRTADGAGGMREMRGARAWAKGASQFAHAMQHASAALIDGSVGLVMAPKGKLFRALRFTFADGKIASAEVIIDRAILDQLEIAAFEG